MGVIANRYAKALVDVSFQMGEQTRVEEELLQFENLLTSNRDLYLFYTNPAIPISRKHAATAEILTKLAFGRTTTNFVFVVIDKHRIRYFAEIRKAFQQRVNQRLGVVQADVITALPLDEDTRSQLQARFEGVTGKKVLLSFDVNNGLVGGFIARVGDTIYDGSVRQQLALIKARLSSD